MKAKKWLPNPKNFFLNGMKIFRDAPGVGIPGALGNIAEVAIKLVTAFTRRSFLCKIK